MSDFRKVSICVTFLFDDPIGIAHNASCSATNRTYSSATFVSESRLVLLSELSVSLDNASAMLDVPGRYSNVGIGCLSLTMAAFVWHMSTQSRTPIPLGTTTTGEVGP